MGGAEEAADTGMALALSQPPIGDGGGGAREIAGYRVCFGAWLELVSSEVDRSQWVTPAERFPWPRYVPLCLDAMFPYKMSGNCVPLFCPAVCRASD